MTGGGVGPQVMTGSAIPGVVANNNPSNCIVTRRSFNRPKSAEHNNSSPLLRRALSPDRPHLRTSEGKCTSVSPLCNQPVSSGSGDKSGVSLGGLSSAGGASGGGQISTTLTAGGSTTTSGIWRSPSATTTVPAVTAQTFIPSSAVSVNSDGGSGGSAAKQSQGNKPEEGLTLNLQSSGEFLPRIAEEKDSPTSCGNTGSAGTGEILKELKGVKVEPVAGVDVKDKIKRFSFGSQLEQQRVEEEERAKKRADKCDKVEVVGAVKKPEEGEKKKKDEVTGKVVEGTSSAMMAGVSGEAGVGGVGAGQEKQLKVEGNSNINQQPTGHSSKDNNSGSSSGGSTKKK